MVKLFLFASTLSVISLSPAFCMDPRESDLSKTSMLLEDSAEEAEKVTKDLKKANKLYETAYKKFADGIANSDSPEQELAKKLMRKAATKGSKGAIEFRKIWGYDAEDFKYASKHFKNNKGKELMKSLACQGYIRAQEFMQEHGEI